MLGLSPNIRKEIKLSNESTNRKEYVLAAFLDIEDALNNVKLV